MSRDFIGLELSPSYAELARRRILDTPLMNACDEASASAWVRPGAPVEGQGVLGEETEQ